MKFAKIALLAMATLSTSAQAAVTCSNYNSTDAPRSGWLTTGWLHSGVQSPPAYMKKRYAKAACVNRLKKIAASCPSYIDFSFRNVVLTRSYNEFSRTDFSHFSGRTWQGGGTARCTFKYKKSRW